MYVLHVPQPNSRPIDSLACPARCKLTQRQNPSRDTSPARGTSQPQEQAIPPIRKTLVEWQKSQNIDRDAQIKITRVAHMRYQHPNLAEITTFMRDFGMNVAKKADGKRWFSGYGTDQYVYYAQEGEKKFLGGTFEVEGFAELEKWAKNILPFWIRGH